MRWTRPQSPAAYFASPRTGSPRPVVLAKLPLYNEVLAALASNTAAALNTVSVLAHLGGPSRYVLGDSMLPTISPDGLVLMEYVEEQDPEGLNNRVYAVIMDGESPRKYVQVCRRHGFVQVVLKGDRLDHLVETLVVGEREFRV